MNTTFDMLAQPDLKYEGPITLEGIEGLKSRLIVALDEIRTREDDEENWESCQETWIAAMQYAGLRCAAIQTKFEFGFVLSAADQKCLDITICVLRDYESAKSLGFRQEEFP